MILTKLKIFQNNIFAEIFSIRQKIYMKMHSSTIWFTSANMLENVKMHSSTIKADLSKVYMKSNNCVVLLTSAKFA